MHVHLLAHLLSASPIARKVLWKWWYNRIAQQEPTHDWTFMNYGLTWPDDKLPSPLSNINETDRLFAQLYHRAVAPGAIQGKNVLEVGSGRGGGAAYIAKHFAPAQMTGVDISRQAIALCNKFHSLPNLKFIEGDAQKLPFPNATFDVLINVESSHCYPSMQRFINEVRRVLRPNGLFLFTDLRDAKDMSKMETLLLKQFELLEQEDLTDLVATALRQSDAHKRARILELCPPAQRNMFEQFAGLNGSLIQTRLESHASLYRRYVFRLKK